MRDLGPLVKYHGPEPSPVPLDRVEGVVYSNAENSRLFVERVLAEPSSMTPEDEQLLALIRPEVLEAVIIDGRKDAYAA